MPTRTIVAIGASAGGVEALQTVIRGLPADFPAAVIVILHLPAGGRSFLADVLRRAGSLPASDAEDGQPILPAHVYVAPPDCHLLVADDRIQLSRGPKEGRQRPAINVTFRSVATNYAERAIGVVLTGMLDDGTAGLWEIKRRGGIAVIQDPDEAVFPSMPVSALNEVSIDHRVRLADMGPLLANLVVEATQGSTSGQVFTGSEQSLSHLTCPECRGPLWANGRGAHAEYRCRVGHAFSTRALLYGQSDTQERKMYEAVVALEEGADLSEYMAARLSSLVRSRLLEEAERLRHDAAEIRAMIQARDPVLLD